MQVQTNTVETKSDEDASNPELAKALEKDSPMKEWLIDYVGNKTNPDNGEVNMMRK